MKRSLAAFAVLYVCLPSLAAAQGWYSQNSTAFGAASDSRALETKRCTNPLLPAVDRIETCSSALKHGRRGDFDLLLGLAKAYRQTGDYTNALSTCDHALADLIGKYAPTELRVLFLTEKAVTYIEAAKTERATELLEEITSVGHDTEPALNSRCWIRAIAGVQLNEALNECNEAVQMDSEDSNALDSRALVELKQKKFEACRNDADASLAHASHMPTSYFMRAFCRAQLGDWDNAAQDYKKASEQDPNIAATFAKYGVLPAPQNSAQGNG